MKIRIARRNLFFAFRRWHRGIYQPCRHLATEPTRKCQRTFQWAIDAALTPTVIKEDVRRVMREMVHPVVLITTCSASAWRPFPSDAKYAKHPFLSPFYINFCAATVSSFTTVSLGPPYPMVSFNLKRPSRTLEGILQHSFFRVCILRANQEGAKVASAFIKGDHAAGFKQVAAQNHWVGLGEPKSIWHILKHPDRYPDAPIVNGPGTFTHFLCEVDKGKCVDVDDHTIVVAKVMEVERWEPEQSAALGLSYAQGRFRGLSEEIDITEHSIAENETKSEYYHLDLLVDRARALFYWMVKQIAHRIATSQEERQRMRSPITFAIHDFVGKEKSICPNDLLYARAAVAFDLRMRTFAGERLLPFRFDLSPTIERLLTRIKEGASITQLRYEWDRCRAGKPGGVVNEKGSDGPNGEHGVIISEQLDLDNPKHMGEKVYIDTFATELEHIDVEDELRSMAPANSATSCMGSAASEKEEMLKSDGKATSASEEGCNRPKE